MWPEAAWQGRCYLGRDEGAGICLTSCPRPHAGPPGRVLMCSRLSSKMIPEPRLFSVLDALVGNTGAERVRVPTCGHAGPGHVNLFCARLSFSSARPCRAMGWSGREGLHPALGVCPVDGELHLPPLLLCVCLLTPMLEFGVTSLFRVEGEQKRCPARPRLSGGES